MVDLHFNLNSVGLRCDRCHVCAIRRLVIDLHVLIARVCGLGLLKWHFNLQYLEVVLLASNCMSAYEKSLD